MLRTIRNIFILLLIGITASGMPIYASSLNLNALIPTIIPKDNNIIVTTDQKIISSNHVQIEYSFSADSNKNYTSILFDEDNPFTVELTSNGDAIKNISIDDLVANGNYKVLEIYNGEPVYIKFDFDREKLDLPYGSYNLILYPNAEGKQFNLEKTEFDINFSSDGTYVSALSTPKTRQTPLTLYFPDEELRYLVPITRFIPYTSSPLTTTLRNLESGPNNEVGLLNGSPIPLNGKAGKVGNTAYINLPTNLGVYNQGSATSTMAVHSLVNSLTSISDISKVQFQFNGKIVQDAFHGMTMDEPYNKPQDTIIYTAYLSTTNRFLLTPIPFDMFGAQYNKNNIPTIFDVMKFKSIPEIYNAKIHPIIPNEVELLDYSLKNDLLTLIFNESFTSVYENNQQLRQMMVDGIVFTFMSLEGVDSINIQVKIDSKDANIREIIHYDFAPPVYINPEI